MNVLENRYRAFEVGVDGVGQKVRCDAWEHVMVINNFPEEGSMSYKKLAEQIENSVPAHVMVHFHQNFNEEDPNA